MMHAARWLLAIGALVVVFTLSGGPAVGGDDLVDNPLYKGWANFKPGSTVTLVEKTTLSGPEAEQVPDGIDHKEITTKLLSVTPKLVVVQVVVVERDFLGAIESAPTKKTYPAKLKKSHLSAGLHGINPTLGKETIKLLGKDLECKTVSGTEKKDTVETKHTVWVSDTVPGGIVKHTRVTNKDGKVAADTNITLKAYKSAE